MAFVTKDWQDSPSTSTPLSAAALEDLETRLAAYSDRFAAAYQTSLPGSPVDGDVIAYGADPTNGVIWLLRYRSGASGSYKWEFIGGTSLLAGVSGAGTRNNAAYGDLSDVAGPAITLPLAGDYQVTIAMKAAAVSASGAALMSYNIGGTGAVDADDLDVFSDTGGKYATRVQLKTALTAVTLTVKYRTSVDMSVSVRTISALPVRVG